MRRVTQRIREVLRSVHFGNIRTHACYSVTSWLRSDAALGNVVISTTLADLLTPLPVANPFLAMRATLLWWLGDKFEDGLPHGWQSWLRRWAVDFFFPVSLF